MELGDVRHRTEHAPLRGSVDVAQEVPAQLRLLLVEQPAEREAEEVALGGSEPADRLALLVLRGLLERVEAEEKAAEIGDVLARGSPCR